MKIRARVFGIAAVCGVLLVVVAIAATTSGRWRVAAAYRLAKGEFGDQINWEDLGRIAMPGSGAWIVPEKNPAAYLTNPIYGADAIAAGATLFEQHCTACHGANARGTDRGPALANAAPKRATSEWATYTTIRRGIRGTAMPAHPLGWRELWQLAAYVRSVKGTAGVAPPAPVEVADVTMEDLIGARDKSDNWLTYSGSYDGNRYSNLSQIQASNVGRLRVAWIHHLGTEHTIQQTVPLVANGIMYFTEPKGVVTAVRADTGKLLWRFEHQVPADLISCCGWARGVAILGKKIFFGTVDGHLYALDAGSGAVAWEILLGDYRQGVGTTSAPLVVNDLVIVGSAGGDFAANGFIAAFHVADGSPAWRFETIPAPGQPGHETWSGNSWKHGGAAPWVTGSYDPASDTLYWGIGNPAPDYNGKVREGTNLYSNTVVALDAKTGKMRWHFQFTPHDTHDYDSAQVPVLVYGDDKAGGAKTLSWANRNGFFYSVDATTGRFLQGRPYARQTWASGLDANGLAIPLLAAEPSEAGTQVWPSSDGGTNWKPPAYDRKRGNLYVAMQERPGIMFIGDASNPEAGTWFGGGSTQGVAGIPIYNAIQALDGKTGELRWEHRFVSSSGLLDRGVEFGGLLATAGDLVFGSSRSILCALDARTGKELWSFDVGANIYAAPITYSVNGQQMIALAAGRVVMGFAVDPPKKSPATAARLAGTSPAAN